MTRLHVAHVIDLSYDNYMADTSHAGRGRKGPAARVQVLDEVSGDPVNGSHLCFQWCRYVYIDGALEEGYRFIWRRPDGSLQPARGQARIPSIEIARKLMDKAVAEGWGKHKGRAQKGVGR
jgi:hypothetical protein